jgi:indolepyruvate ferredoxin oxidoreductase alpha subunit
VAAELGKLRANGGRFVEDVLSAGGGAGGVTQGSDADSDAGGVIRSDELPHVEWSVNEKAALELAWGCSISGGRALVTMKQVGLNVACDPLLTMAYLGVQGGLVLYVADDPGPISSQTEQDSRQFAQFAKVPVLDPATPEEAFAMLGPAFELSERFRIPVMLRLTTRLSHARSTVSPGPERGQNPLAKAEDKTRWMLLPAHARRNYASLIEKQSALLAWSAAHRVNKLEIEGRDLSLALITSGLGGNYYEENLEDFVRFRGGRIPARLHIGAYPLPAESIRGLCEKAERVLVIEEGQPFIEERLRGILPQGIAVSGKLDGTLVRTGELDPDNVRKSLGLAPRPGVPVFSVPAGPEARTPPFPLPGRPPQLCQGCPHGDSYAALKKALEGLDSVIVNSDIGCYSLGAAPPYSAIESIVCMGASIGMAKGAADAGIKHALAVIGDSTFLHSGITGLIDAAAEDTPITVIILDNSIVAMTGCQETKVPSAKLPALILGLGVKREHLLELEAKRQLVEENALKLRKEIDYPGLSVVIFKRECLEAARKRRKAPGDTKTTGAEN